MRARVLDAEASHLDTAGCSCSREALGRKPQATIDSYVVQVVEGIPGKAQIVPGSGHIQVDSRFWSSINQVTRDAVLNHEMAHDEDPNACEPCADARAGARLRWQGYGAEQSAAALNNVVRSRQAGAAVLEGWRAADAVVRRRSSETAGLAPAEDIAAVNFYKEPWHDPSETRVDVGVMSVDSLKSRSHRSRARALTEGEDHDIEFSVGTPDVAPSTPPRSSTPRPATPTPPASPKSDSSSLALFAGIALLVFALTRK